MGIEGVVLGQLGMVQRGLESPSLVVPTRLLVALVGVQQLFRSALVMLPDVLCICFFEDLIFLAHVISFSIHFKKYRRSKQAMLLHMALQRHATWTVELLVNVVQVQLGRAFADEQLAGDFFIGPALGDHARHRQFTWRQQL